MFFAGLFFNFNFLQMTFLPNDYKEPNTSANGGYFKLEQGDNRFRILTDCVIGWEAWKIDQEGKNRPHRFGIEDKPNGNDFDTKVKLFWAFGVYNYKADEVQILHLTQASIRNAILAYIDDEDFGEPQGYDLTIKRSGQGMETEYLVLASPPKEPKKEVAEALQDLKLDLSKHINGGNPFESNAPF